MAVKYYYIVSDDHYLNGKENIFYKGKLNLGTFTNSKLEADKIKFHHTNLKKNDLKDLTEELKSINGNSKSAKEKRIELQKEIKLKEKEFELYENCEVKEIPIDKIIEAQNLLKLNAIFIGDVYSYFLNDLKDNLLELTRLSRSDVNAIKVAQKALKGNNFDFEKLVRKQEDLTYDFQEEYIKMVQNISEVGFSEPKLLNEYLEMMKDKQGLATIKRALTNFKKKKNEIHN